MKGIINILELLLTGILLVLAFLHFFPQYSIKNEWSSVLLDLSVIDTLNTIDRLNKTYDYAVASGIDNDFEIFMDKIYSPQYYGEPLVWWKELHGLGSNTTVPYFTEAKRETIVDVVVLDDEFYVYSFSLGLGYPY